MVGESDKNVFLIQTDASSFIRIRDIRVRDSESRLFFTFALRSLCTYTKMKYFTQLSLSLWRLYANPSLTRTNNKTADNKCKLRNRISIFYNRALTGSDSLGHIVLRRLHNLQKPIEIYVHNVLTLIEITLFF